MFIVNIINDSLRQGKINDTNLLYIKFSTIIFLQNLNKFKNKFDYLFHFFKKNLYLSLIVPVNCWFLNNVFSKVRLDNGH